MSKQSNVDSLQIQINRSRNFRKINGNSLIQNSDNNNNLRRIQNPRTEDIQGYLQTEDYFPGKSYDESLDHHQNYKEDSEQAEQSYKIKRLIVELGEDYTFVDDKANKKYQEIMKNSQGQSSQISNQFSSFSQLYSKHKNRDSRSNSASNNQSQSQQHPDYHVQFLNNQKQFSLSDNQQDSGVMVYEQKEIKEQMFLKISSQTKQILNLQEKLYYYQDYCRRLLKSQQESSSKKNSLVEQLTQTKSTLEYKKQVIKQLEFKLIQSQKQITKLQSTMYAYKLQNYKLQNYKLQNSKPLNPKPLNPKPQNPKPQNRTYRRKMTNSSASKLESKMLHQLQSANIKLQLQVQTQKTQKNILNEKYKALSICYTQIQNKLSILQNQLYLSKQQNKKIIQKNKNIQDINKILQRQISQLNINIFQLQQEIQQTTFNKYKHNLTRIKNLSTQGNQDILGWKNTFSTKQEFQNTFRNTVARKFTLQDSWNKKKV